MELALDHLTVADATPAQLVEIAAIAGARAVCLFLEPMPVLPRMPSFELIGRTRERCETRTLMEGLGIELDLVYPFTLGGRTEIAAFRPALETAAFLGARMANALVYDRDPARRLDRFSAFCELAAEYGMGVALEFYPTSQVRTLPDALELVRAVGRAGRVGVNVDLLHLVRSGGSVADVAAAPRGTVVYGQFCDGPISAPADPEFEASSQRNLAGDGDFDLRGFADALPIEARASVELPQDAALAKGAPTADRAALALQGVRAAIAGGGLR